MYNSPILVFCLLCTVALVALLVTLYATVRFVEGRDELLLKKVSRRLTKKNSPHVDILIVQSGDEDQLKNTLKDIDKINYDNKNISIFDGNETRLSINSRLAGTRPEDLVMVLTAGESLDTRRFKRIVSAKMSKVKQQPDTERPKPISLIDLVKLAESILWEERKSPQVYSASSFVKTKNRLILKVSSHGSSTNRILGNLLVFLVFANSYLLFGAMGVLYSWLLCLLVGLYVVWLRYGIDLRDRLTVSFLLPSATLVVPVSKIIVGAYEMWLYVRNLTYKPSLKVLNKSES